MKNLSIWDNPTAAPQTMPLKLKLVIGGYLLWILQDAWLLASVGVTTKLAVRIAIGVAAVVFLARGSDLARASARVVAAIGGVLGIMALVQLGSLGVTSWIMISAAVSTVLAAFMFWALGQDDVRSWMRTRSPVAMPPAIASFGGERTR